MLRGPPIIPAMEWRFLAVYDTFDHFPIVNKHTSISSAVFREVSAEFFDSVALSLSSLPRLPSISN